MCGRLFGGICSVITKNQERGIELPMPRSFCSETQKEQAPTANAVEACKKLRNKMDFTVLFVIILLEPFTDALLAERSPARIYQVMKISHMTTLISLCEPASQTASHPVYPDAVRSMLDYLVFLFSAVSFICARMAL